ncbi:MAG: class II fructose-bisphosphate aldolase [Lachnospiraceae bacterium]|nr:class II fructose-bisphosphate aldolase [Lachnospiraceae bacterium]
MLVTMKEILDRANKEWYGVPAPNVGGEREARAAIEAAEELNSPMILDVSYNAHPDIIFLGSYLTRLADQSTVPVAINLDHGGHASIAQLRDPITALRAGFSSIMVDRSMFPFEENLRMVAEIVPIAHSVGVSVEAELGHVGEGEHADTTSVLTDPSEALDYIQRTGVDCLAVSIGSAHGAYAKNIIPKIDFDRLHELKKVTNEFPLVMHGGSGTGDENIRRACQEGINKVNLCNELLQAAANRLKTADLTGNGAYALFDILVAGWKDRLLFQIENMGSAGKAWPTGPRGVKTDVATTMAE